MKTKLLLVVMFCVVMIPQLMTQRQVIQMRKYVIMSSYTMYINFHKCMHLRIGKHTRGDTE